MLRLHFVKLVKNIFNKIVLYKIPYKQILLWFYFTHTQSDVLITF